MFFDILRQFGLYNSAYEKGCDLMFFDILRQCERFYVDQTPVVI